MHRSHARALALAMPRARSPLLGTLSMDGTGKVSFHLHQVQVEAVASTRGESCTARGWSAATFWLKLSS
eukprot:2498629-Alexandrium_andersonii.AAC.1